MAELTTLARPYAKAAFEVAVENNALDNWSSMLSLLENVASVGSVRAVLTSPTYTAEELASTLINLCGEELDQKGKNFITMLAENKRLELISQISAIYEILKANKLQSVDVEITTAFEVTQEASDKLVQALKSRLQRDIKLASKVDPGLIGGAIIRAGDTVIDSSIRGKLNKLAEAMNS